MKCVVWVFQVRKFHIPGKKTELLFDIAAFMQIVFIGIVKVKFLYGNKFVISSYYSELPPTMPILQ